MKKHRTIFVILIFSFTGFKAWANPPGKEIEEQPSTKAMPSLPYDENEHPLHTEKPDQNNAFGFPQESKEEGEEIEQSGMFFLGPDFEELDDERFKTEEDRFEPLEEKGINGVNSFAKEEEEDRFQDGRLEERNLQEKTAFFQKKKE